MAFLVQDGNFVGWTARTGPLRDHGFATPDPTPPRPVHPLPVPACMDLVTTLWLDAVRHRDLAAASGLRELDHRLRDQREYQNRADPLLALIGELVEDYGSR